MLPVPRGVQVLQSLVSRCCKKSSKWCLLSADVHIHRDSAMHKHCLRELHPIASVCLMQQPPRCSETFLNDTSPWLLCHKRT